MAKKYDLVDFELSQVGPPNGSGLAFVEPRADPLFALAR